jgi:hypothetical protein
MQRIAISLRADERRNSETQRLSASKSLRFIARLPFVEKRFNQLRLGINAASLIPLRCHLSSCLSCLIIGRITTAKVMVMEHMLNATKKIKGHKFDNTKSSMPILALKAVAADRFLFVSANLLT